MTKDVAELSNSSLLAALQTPLLRETLDTLVVVLDRQGRIVSFNAACERSTGYRETEIRGRSIRCLIPAAQQDSVMRAFDNLLAGSTLSSHVHAWQGKGGRRITIQWSNTVLRDSAGTVEYVVATGIDITSYQDSVTTLLETSCRYQALVETSSDWIWEVDADMRYTYSSLRVEHILGYAPREILGRTPHDLMPPNEAGEMWAPFEEIARQRQPFHHRISCKLHKSGSRVYLESSGIPFFNQSGELAGYRGTSRDITSRYQTEQALRESEQRLRISQQFANIGTWEWDIASGDLYWSEQVWPMFGYPVERLEATYNNFLRAIHPDDLEQVVEAIHTCLETEQRYDIEHRVVWPNGQVNWVRGIGNVTKDEDGRALRMMGVLIDIDSRKKAELRLIQSEQKYRLLIENAADAIIVLDSEGRILDVNQRLCRLYGYARDEMIGCPFPWFSPPERKQYHQDLFAEMLASEIPLTLETEIRTRNGGCVPVEVRASVLRMADGTIIQAILRDIRERKQLEAERLAMAEAQRDTLVREVHHRIKNNLQGIVGLLRSELQTEQADLAQAVETAIGQIRSIALVYGVYGQRPDAVLLLCEMLVAIAQAVGDGGDAAVDVKLRVHTPLQVKEAEAVALALILNELITNSRKHSMGNEGPVQISLEAADGRGMVKILAPGGRLPDGFDFERGLRCGTGLELVRALLPRQGLQVQYEQTERGVVTRLLFAAPVVTLHTGLSCLHVKETVPGTDKQPLPSSPAGPDVTRSGS